VARLRHPGADEALDFAAGAYAGRVDRPGRIPEHPVAVARLVAGEHWSPDVTTAALLHDVLEDTDVTAQDLRARFGPDVARLVEALTEDAGIPRYQDRKADLRRRTVEAGEATAAIALADKLAKVTGADRAPKARKLAHYRATLEAVEAAYGRTSLSRRLRQELDRWPEG
jgi:(p)ppGpp synthase/HD superfamily hydrolase